MKYLLSALGFLVLTSCAEPQSSSVDIRMELMEADRAFAARALEIGPGPAFVEFASEDVRTFPDGSMTRKGKASLVASTEKWSEDLQIFWEPEEAFDGRGDDFGYTWGYSEFHSLDEQGEKVVSYGKYVTIWRKEPDGQWKWIADLGNTAPSPEERAVNSAE